MTRTPATAVRRPSLREQQKELTRERIVAAALEAFEANGFIATTLEGIAGHAGLSRPTIYLHFDNKTDILRAAVAKLPELRPLLETILAADDRRARRAGFAALNDYWHEHLGPVWAFVREAAAVDAGMQEWVDRFVADQTVMIRRRLEREGVPRQAARARALLIWCAWHEYLFRLDRAAREAGRDTWATALTDQFEAALRP